MELKVGNKVKLNDLGVMFVNMVGDNHDDNYEGKIVEVKENTYGESYLVQFPKGFDGHDGNGRSEKVYEDNNVMFLPDIALELIEDEDDDDEELTLSKLIDILVSMGKPETLVDSLFVPYIKTSVGNRGVIGDETKFVDINNSKLFVGDIVKVEGNFVPPTNTFVAKDTDDRPVIMGLGYRDKGFKVTKLIDHSIAHDYLDILEVPFKVEYVMEENHD